MKADELGIFIVDGDPRVKFSLKYVKRFDMVDSFLDDDTDGSLAVPAQTNLSLDYHNVIQFQITRFNILQTATKLPEIQQVSSPLRITLERNKERKVIVLNDKTISELVKLSKQKFNVKCKKFKCKGTELLVDEQLIDLAPDSVILVS